MHLLLYMQEGFTPLYVMVAAIGSIYCDDDFTRAFQAVYNVHYSFRDWYHPARPPGAQEAMPVPFASKRSRQRTSGHASAPVQVFGGNLLNALARAEYSEGDDPRDLLTWLTETKGQSIDDVDKVCGRVEVTKVCAFESCYTLQSVTW